MASVEFEGEIFENLTEPAAKKKAMTLVGAAMKKILAKVYNKDGKLVAKCYPDRVDYRVNK